MFTLPNFCRVCLKYDKNLIDLAHIENEPSETLMSKLQLCVSEVEWTVFKPLLCHPCIKRLNIAYSFKKQCVQSAGVLKNYVELVKESQKKNESQNAVKSETILPTTGGAYMLLPNQKYVKILVGSQNQVQVPNTFQNVFLNLIPANTLNSVVTPTTGSATPVKTKDTNQNVFLNLNNTFQKFIPVQPTETPSKKNIDTPKPVNVNVNQLLTETKTEELSVEIDPTVFGLEEDEDDSHDDEANDYDEVISSAKITLKDLKSNGEKIQNGKEDQKYYVPILPKNQDDFFSSGQHFLFSSPENTVPFGKITVQVRVLLTEFATRAEYDLCIKAHCIETESANKSLTLQDFAASQSLNDSQLSEVEAIANIPPTENGEYVCDVCCRPFNSSTGLLRHKVRKHNQKNKKKYFIKGMKNARCDICNREFSTQSYMQLHKKLHLRDDIGYKYKVFGKSKYGESDTPPKESKAKAKVKKEKCEVGKEDEEEKECEDPLEDTFVENLDVTPDILTEEDDRKSDDDSNDAESKHDYSFSANEVSMVMEIEQDASDREDNSEDNSQNGENSNTENSNQGEIMHMDEDEKD
ncbi:hypothetical protein JTB14_033525 [Gonioctena quinquepunctata]|nr:hypothetical protein JTB14_033525 [Gonioctena quinquepunctata]